MEQDLRIDGPAMRAWFDLKGTRDDLAAWLREARLPPWPGRPNSRTGADGVALLWLGPEHWMLTAPLEREAALAAALRCANAPDTVSLHVLSDSLSVFTLTGAGAEAAMAAATPLDLHERAFAGDAAAFTEAFGVRALVTRAPGGFDLVVDRSSADFVAQWLSGVAG